MMDFTPIDPTATRLSSFPSAYKPADPRMITLAEAIGEIRTPRHQDRTDQLRTLLMKNKDAYERAKKKLPGITFSGTFTYRSIAGLKQVSGLLTQEIDLSPKIPNLRRCEELKAQFVNDPFIVLVFTSLSAAGLRLIFRIPVVDGHDPYQALWGQVSDYIEQTYNITTDKACKDISRLLFVSYDPDIYVNPAAVPFPGYRGARELIRARAELENMVDGQRYVTRNKLGFTLGGHVAGGTLEESHGARVLNGVIERTTKHPDKSHSAFWKAVEDGKKRPIQPEGEERSQSQLCVPSGSDESEAQPQPADVRRSGEAGSLPTTSYGDVFNAECLILRYGDILRHCQEWNAWFIWKGTHWAKDRESEVYDYARDTLKWVLDIAFDTENEKLMRHVAKSRSHRGLGNMLAQAGTMCIRRLPEHFDTHPHLLNCKNGTIDLHDGTLLEHDPDHLITKCAPVDYDSEAKCPKWESFLLQIMGGEDLVITPDDTVADMERKEEAAKSSHEMIGFLQRAVGYSLYGTNREKALLIPWGGGDNGKTTLIETLAELLGEGYAKRVATSVFLSKQNDGIPNDVAALLGVRFAYAAEPQQGRRLDEALIKDLTGGDTLTARFMRGEFFTFRPQCTLWLLTNHKPPTRDTGNALWNRIKLIPFTVSIPKEKQDQELKAKLLVEASGILAWAVEGCLDWQEGGLREPDPVKAATAEYRQENDTVGLFIAENCVVLPQAAARSSDLYEQYKRFCDQVGERAMSGTLFSKALKEKGFESRRSNGTWFDGIGLAAKEAHPETADKNRS